MTVTKPDFGDVISRTHLLLAHRGLVDDLDDAGVWLGRNHVHVVVSARACQSPSAQAAAMTVVTLAARASMSVTVDLGDPDATVVRGHLRGTRLEGALGRLGALDGASDAPLGTMLIGDAAHGERQGSNSIQITWQRWVAAVRTSGQRLADDDDNPLAAIAAAALGLSELFHGILGNVEAGWRDVTFSLWNPLAPDPLEDAGPPIAFLPARWMFVGLGHLGQAAAWCLSHLPYPEGTGEVWLVDDDIASFANLSTGVFTEPADAASATRKTRLVASCLEAAGRSTRLWETRLPTSYRYEIDHPDVALVGVDNVRTRLSLSDVGWPLCVDTGLGSTPSSFSSFVLHVFPSSRLSRDVAAWQQSPRAVDESALPAAIERLVQQSTMDRCGAVLLAGRVVAAAFVGVVASCFSVAEPLRNLHGSGGLEVATLELSSVSFRGSANPIEPARLASIRAESHHRVGGRRPTSPYGFPGVPQPCHNSTGS